MKQKLIADLIPGDSVLSYFILRKKEIKEKKANNEIYLSLEFGDRSGRIKGSLWKNVLEINKNLQLADVVKGCPVFPPPLRSVHKGGAGISQGFDGPDIYMTIGGSNSVGLPFAVSDSPHTITAIL